MTRSYQQVLIKWLDYGMLKQVNVFKFFKVMRIKSFHVCLIIKVILLLLVQKIIHVKYGEILRFMERKKYELIDKM